MLLKLATCGTSATSARFDMLPLHRHRRPALRTLRSLRGDNAVVTAVSGQLRVLVQIVPLGTFAADAGYRRVLPIEAVAGRVDILRCCETPHQLGRGSAGTMEWARWSVVRIHTQIQRHGMARFGLGLGVMHFGYLLSTLQALPCMPVVVLDCGRVSSMTGLLMRLRAVFQSETAGASCLRYFPDLPAWLPQSVLGWRGAVGSIRIAGSRWLQDQNRTESAPFRHWTPYWWGKVSWIVRVPHLNKNRCRYYWPDSGAAAKVGLLS